MGWLRRVLGRLVGRGAAGGGGDVASSADGDAGALKLAREQIRGSSMLLSGRGLALGLKFVSQLLMVRYLTTADYGAWSYALAATTLLIGFSSLSLDRAVSRFAAIYHQRGEYDRFFGTLLLVAGVIIGTGILFAGAVYAFPSLVLRLMGGREEALTLLFVIIFLVPLEALDQLGISIFATLGRAGAIFFRKYLLTPILQLVVVGLLVVRGAGIEFFAVAYVAAWVVGVAVNAALLVRMLEEEGLLEHLSLRSVTVPLRELFGFAAPLMTSDWLAVLVDSSSLLLLGYFAGTEDVALLKVVIPIAMLNRVVIRSFNLLYVPAASRLFADGDTQGIKDLYRRMSLWVSVISFPVFAVTFLAATPLVVLLYGARYEASGAILSVLALGVYLKTTVAFSGVTLKVLGRIRYLVGSNVTAGVLNLALNFVLVPRFGAMGAGIAMAATVVADALLKQAGVFRAMGVTVLSGDYLQPRAALGAVVAALIAARLLGAGHIVFLGTVAVVACLVVLALTLRDLRIGAMFPELARIPLLRGVLQ